MSSRFSTALLCTAFFLIIVCEPLLQDANAASRSGQGSQALSGSSGNQNGEGNSGQTSPPDEATIRSEAPPVTDPTVLSLDSAPVDGAFTVRWSPQPNYTGYSLRESVNGSSFMPINGNDVHDPTHDLGFEDHTFDGSTAKAPGTYHYKIALCYLFGPPVEQETVCLFDVGYNTLEVIVTEPDPDIPGIPNASVPDFNGDFTLQWVDATLDDGYEIEQIEAGSDWTAVSGLVSIDAPNRLASIDNQPEATAFVLKAATIPDNVVLPLAKAQSSMW